ncbi:TAXI family TRAP transporter solute-binding subunit [Plastoroseomonas arctica]|uniref:TAXI family TRAP transporter solute-binding subunit n=1 Tax=Plastoroseomonas arctica TaxID=1509237 RepID=A0AAF1JXN7_9PROT|nr:TAXI family TRAP transporter solute-binding subunit [Plastoroseomonas arctica]MBR0656371.1 TAXI family TRAP transporter solute-binding subunit [Plastoroseomonas arctica]
MTGITRRAALASAGILAAPAALRAQAAQQLAIATGTTGGVYYPLGGALANYLSRGIPGMSATVEVTGGSTANFQLLGANRVGLLFGQVDAGVDAIRGAGPFRGRVVPARAIAVLYTNRMQVVTTTSTGVRTMGDLRGKRISTGAPGSATELFALRVIEAAGLNIASDFRGRERLSPAESTNALKDGKIDAYFFVSGVPTSAITDLAATPGTTLHLIDHANLHAAIVEKHGPVYFPEVIPAGTYPGQTTDNAQLSVANVLAVREDMPAALVTQILNITWSSREDWARVHAEARNFNLAAQKTAAAGIPWHPAAEAFWRGQGATL